jgi:hypothetical protein
MKKVKPSSVPERIHGFRKRWSLELSDEARWTEFKDRFMNTYADVIGLHFMSSDVKEDEFYRLIGKHKRAKEVDEDFGRWDVIRMLGSCPVYQLMVSTRNMMEFTLQVQALFWVSSLEASKKQELRRRLLEDIRSSGVAMEVTGTGTSVLLYPAGARTLDEGVVNESLTWLEPVKDAHDRFAMGLSLLGKPGAARVVVDNQRLSLELTMRDVLGNTKSLENQQPVLGAFLKDKEVGGEVANMYLKLIDLYSKFQNDRAKHGNKVQEQEVEFILYLTGTFIRFLVTLR